MIEMTDSVSKFEKATAEVLRWLRLQGFSYGDARHVLTSAGAVLQIMVDMELSYLPMAGGIEDRFNPDCLNLSSKEIVDAHSKCSESCDDRT